MNLCAVSTAFSLGWFLVCCWVLLGSEGQWVVEWA